MQAFSQAAEGIRTSTCLLLGGDVLGEALSGARLVEHRSTHPVEDLHLTAQAISEAETENAVADPVIGPTILS
jgi:hypothetical protein